MKKVNAKWLLLVFAVIQCAIILVSGIAVYITDPLFHYHKPNTDKYYYVINNERSQNNGILRHFDYDAIITGTSMAENFKTSQMDELFGTNSVKVPCYGGTLYEIEGNVEAGLKYNPKLKTVVRGIDTGKLFEKSDALRLELGEYPMYLYDDKLYNDVNYLLNRDVIFNRVYPMIRASKQEGAVAGITSFDEYANWSNEYLYGIEYVCPNGVKPAVPGTPIHITDNEKRVITETIEKNLVAVTKEYPDVTFYYFFTPYSAVWWENEVNNGEIYAQLEAERMYITELLKCDNVRLYSFNADAQIVADMNNYKDEMHYGEWINELMLQYMYDGEYLLTADNYESYLEEEQRFFLDMDYTCLNR